MSRDPRILLQQLDAAAAEVEQYIDGLDYAEFTGHRMMQVSMKYSFIVIGEALNRLGQISPGLAKRIPELRQAVAFRNQMTHGYYQVELDEVWDTAVNDLPDLRHTVQSLLAELELAAEAEETSDTAEVSFDPFMDAPSPFD